MNATVNLRVPEAMELVKPTEKRPLGRPRRRWEDNIRMDFEETELIYLYFPPSVLTIRWKDGGK